MHPLLQQAFALHRQGKFAEAGRAYSEILRERPNDFDANHLLGVLALQLGRNAEGVGLINRALGANPRSHEALNNLGKGLDALGRGEEALTQFARAIELRPDFADAYLNRGHLLMRLSRPAEALASFEALLARHAGLSAALNGRGMALGELGRDAEAVANYDQLLAAEPRSAEAHGNRGLALSKLRRFDEALASLDRAIALKPDVAESHNGRGMALRELARTEEALASYDRALALRPAFAEAHNNRATALRELGRLDEAVQAYDASLALRPDMPDVLFNRGQCLLAMGRFADGWRGYESRKRKTPPIGVRAVDAPLWRGDDLIGGQTILLHWEQGYGDSIQFARYAPLLEQMGAAVVISVQTPLMGLLQSLSPTISIVGPHDTPNGIDCHCPLLSLPLAFGTTAETVPANIPYLSAAPERIATWEQKLGPKTKPRVGIVWSGSAAHTNDARRSIPLAMMLTLASGNIETISLQKELRGGDGDMLAARPDILRLGDAVGDFADTAALCAAMDLIVTVDTSVAHLAGALGKPVWILLPSNPDWRWGHAGGTTPWYPTARLFRQQRPGDWTGALAEVRAALDGQFNA